MKNLEKITNKIKSKNSRLMELSRGCKIKYLPLQFKNREIPTPLPFEFEILGIDGGGQIADTGDYSDVYVTLYSHQFDNNTYIVNIDDIDENDIIGHDVKLNDILEYLLDKKVKTYLWERYFVIQFKNGGYWVAEIFWDLSSIFLKDQKEELINDLIKLIEKTHK